MINVSIEVSVSASDGVGEHHTIINVAILSYNPRNLDLQSIEDAPNTENDKFPYSIAMTASAIVGC